MLGVVLFTIALLFYGIILSGEAAIKAFPNSKGFFEKIDNFIEKGPARFFLALICLIVGIWNLIAPNFVATNAPILGALIPSLILCADSAVIYPGMIEIINIPDDSKAKYYEFVEKYKGMAGVVTIFFGLLHPILFRQILF